MSRLSGLGQLIVFYALLTLFSLSVQANDRFNWSSNVWVQPSWSSSWGNHYPNYSSGWRWGLGVGTGSPYWNNHSYYWNRPWYRPYWRNNWGYPYRYRDNYRNTYTKPTVPKVISAPEQITTSVQFASGLKSLPANARAIQKNGHTIYQWQGVEYQFDWQSETYREVK
ncbi:hypothetical protein [Shewanella woodyi]|uniref:hypothetical protein n=1 Tax=Shewanella woodyi TaxID=60961 RepID=UPI0037488C19